MLIINPTAGRERAKYHKDALKAQLDHDIRECRERYHSFQKSQLG